VEWLTDIPTALNKARAENKVVMLDFTGSDWCGWCKRLKREVFDQPEFAAFAQDNLILVEVDFPHSIPQSREQAAANNALSRKYNIQGFPTIVLIDAASREVGRSGYRPGGPKNYIAELEQVPGVKHGSGAVAANAQPDTTRAPHPQPAFVPIPPAQPMHYGELTLKGISGANNQRFALINNQTLAVGETAKVKVHDDRVEITCVAIYKESVLISIGGNKMELKLRQE
jgi:protein disulfide-isomerase